VSNAYEHGAAAVLFLNDDYDIQKNLAQLEKRWQGAVDQIAEQNKKFQAIETPSDAKMKANRDKIEKLADEIKSLRKQMQTGRDPILTFNQAGTDNGGRNIPVLFCRRAELDPVIKAALNTDLVTLEKEIDKGPEPHSAELTGWHAVGETMVERKEVDVKNV